MRNFIQSIISAVWYNWRKVIQFVFFIGLICMIGCDRSVNKVYYDKSYNEISTIANDTELPFCIVLVDSTQSLSQEYIAQFDQKQNLMTRKTIFCINDVNTPEGEWLLKWLCPASLPLTCVFASRGDLIDLIPGTSIETFLYIDEAVKNSATTNFHWSNLFKKDKQRVLPLLNSLLAYRKFLDQGVYLSEDIDNVIDSLPYPYSCYLKLTGTLMEQDSVEARAVAKQLLALETPYVMELYKDEFVTAKTVLNKDYKIENDAVIRVDQSTINLRDCKVGENTPVYVNVYNDGKELLVISKVHVSCSCLEQIDTRDQITVNPGQSAKLKFNFTPDIKGDIFRDIFIVSNGVNMPILHIHIIATVTC
ncbi:Ig-like domain-containing protein [Coprobacter sp.]